MLNLIKKIPLIKPLFSFSKESHFQASPKFIVLWIMSTLPIFLAASLTQKPVNSEDDWDGFISILSSSFSATEQFVYTAAFIPPIIYLVFDRYIEAEIEAKFIERIKFTMRKVFHGYWSVFIVAIIVLFLTTITYTGTKTNFANMQNTYLYGVSVSSASLCYFFALYCWYLSILDGTRDASDFVGDNRDTEDNLTGKFKDRLNARGAV